MLSHMNNTEYPTLEISTEKWLKEQLVSFYFQLTRTQSTPCLETILQCFRHHKKQVSRRMYSKKIPSLFLYFNRTNERYS